MNSERRRVELRYATVARYAKLPQEQFTYELLLCRRFCEDLIMDVFWARRHLAMPQWEEEALIRLSVEAQASYFQLLWALSEINPEN